MRASSLHLCIQQSELPISRCSFTSDTQTNSSCLVSVFFVAKIKPAVIVDKIIEAAVDILVPGRGAGEGNW